MGLLVLGGVLDQCVVQALLESPVVLLAAPPGQGRQRGLDHRRTHRIEPPPERVGAVAAPPDGELALFEKFLGSVGEPVRVAGVQVVLTGVPEPAHALRARPLQELCLLEDVGRTTCPPGRARGMGHLDQVWEADLSLLHRPRALPELVQLAAYGQPILDRTLTHLAVMA